MGRMRGLASLRIRRSFVWVFVGKGGTRGLGWARLGGMEELGEKSIWASAV